MTVKEATPGKQALPLGGLNSHKSSQRLEQIARLRARGVGEHFENLGEHEHTLPITLPHAMNVMLGHNDGALAAQC